MSRTAKTDAGKSSEGSPRPVSPVAARDGWCHGQPDIEAIVAKTTELVIRQTIDIPRISVLPVGDVRSGFSPFTLKLDTLNYPPVSEELGRTCARIKWM